jgi:hypothetical protein
MTDKQRTKLHDALMAAVSEQAPVGSVEWKIYDESVTEDIRIIEPLIDEFIMENTIKIATEVFKICEKGDHHAISKDSGISGD